MFIVLRELTVAAATFIIVGTVQALFADEGRRRLASKPYQTKAMSSTTKPSNYMAFRNLDLLATNRSKRA